jgi:7,8-dihydropterin-6-yl-methyl-4-(beta-D-ribofuranosyl)aminobenzene 5'-phosphate synthase
MTTGGPSAPALAEVDRVEVLCLVDNVIDGLLPGSEVVKRASIRPKDGPSDPAPLMASGRAAQTLRAEHGFSALITTFRDGRRGSILLDTGMTVDAITHNMSVLSLDVRTIDGVVLSHGHFDHAGGLSGLPDGLRNGLPLTVHPDVWLQRRMAFPNSEPMPLPGLSRQAVIEAGFDVIESRGPSLLLDGTALVTGEVERTTGFETGFPNQEALRDGEWASDVAMLDDQAIVMNVRDKGLVVVSGCGHAGIVNILRYACKLSGVDRLHAVVGGFHLSGPRFEPIIPATISAILSLAPKWVVPVHCTGWKAVHAFAAAMPDQFIQNSVGSTYAF